MSAITPERGESDKIFLEGVRFYGHHGVTPAEQAVGAWFSVDVELSLNLTPAVLSDDLASAVDYSEVGRRIVEIGTKERCSLLERLAGMLAEALLREFPIHEVRIRLRKLTAFMEGIPGVPGVELMRRR